jgi:endonuclease YncB( thermonuclease family)
VACEQHEVDRYGRIVAVCRAGGEDLNAWLVSQGGALAYRHYSTAYVDEEDVARAAQLGIWRGAFTAPWDWRRGRR